MSMPERLTQIQAGYLPRGPFRCDRCVWFNKPNSCALVTGSINPGGCCNGWQRESGQNGYKFSSAQAFKEIIASGGV